jgi:hypothetical protein
MMDGRGGDSRQAQKILFILKAAKQIWGPTGILYIEYLGLSPLE